MTWHILTPTNRSALTRSVLCGAKDVRDNTTRPEFVSQRLVDTGVVCPECAKLRFLQENVDPNITTVYEEVKEPKSRKGRGRLLK